MKFIIVLTFATIAKAFMGSPVNGNVGRPAGHNQQQQWQWGQDDQVQILEESLNW